MKLKYIKFIGLIFFSSCLFFSKDLLISTLSILKTVGLENWLLAFFLIFLCPCVAALRTKLLITETGHQAKLGCLLVDSLFSFGLNAISVSGVGEAYRIKRLSEYGVPVALGMGIVVLDRISGILAFTFTAFVVFLGGGYSGLNLFFNFVYLFALLVFFLLVIILFRNQIGAFLRLRIRIIEPILKLQSVSFLTITSVIALGFLTCILTICGVFFAGKAIDLNLGFSEYLFNVPLIAITALFLPISIGGLGLREIGYFILFKRYGVSMDESIALGITQYSTYIATGLVGTLLFFLHALYPNKLRSNQIDF